MGKPVENEGRPENTPCSISSIRPGEVKKVGLITLSRIKNYASSHDIPEEDIIALLAKRYKEGDTVKGLAEEVGIVAHSLRGLFLHCGIPIRSSSETTRQRNMKCWQDPEYRDAMIEATRERWEDPEFRTRVITTMEANWENPEFRAKQLGPIMERLPLTLHSPDAKARAVEAVKQNWQNPEYRAMMAGHGSRNLKTLWADPDYRQRQAELSRSRMLQRRQNPNFLRRISIASSQNLTKLWLNPGFREKAIEAARQARSNPDNEGRYFLPTVSGVRRDVGFCQSTWEANLGRVIRLAGREYLKREPFRLSVPEEYQAPLQLPQVTDFYLDYLTLDPRGNFVGYEIMAHPLEGEEGWLKVQLFTFQHPEVKLVVVGKRLYKNLRRYFRDRVNNHPELIGWETSEDSLRSNPQKWSV